MLRNSYREHDGSIRLDPPSDHIGGVHTSRGGQSQPQPTMGLGVGLEGDVGSVEFPEEEIFSVSGEVQHVVKLFRGGGSVRTVIAEGGCPREEQAKTE